VYTSRQAVCVNNTNVEDFLSIGDTYTVIGEYPLEYNEISYYVLMEDDSGQTNNYSKSRFKLLDQEKTNV
jgi:hypothetical protein